MFSLKRNGNAKGLVEEMYREFRYHCNGTEGVVDRENHHAPEWEGETN